MEILQKKDEYPNVALLRHGLLGCTPTDPSITVTIECLELYHQIHQRQSSFSVQAICKVLCALHNVCWLYLDVGDLLTLCHALLRTVYVTPGTPGTNS
ncbi:MAG TPA: hypothetical protein VGO47_09880, partial [Chlamydiales bacterium]|nr:hypothetical protein [Chlamydiales bacterium]